MLLVPLLPLRWQHDPCDVLSGVCHSVPVLKLQLILYETAELPAGTSTSTGSTSSQVRMYTAVLNLAPNVSNYELMHGWNSGRAVLLQSI